MANNENLEDKNKGGRPTKITDEVLRKLKDAFLRGASNSLACIYAGLAESTFYDYCNENERFSEEKEGWKKRPSMKALDIINKSLQEEDINTAKWYAERKMKEEFSLRTEKTGKDGKDLPSSVVIIKDDIKRSKPKKEKS